MFFLLVSRLYFFSWLVLTCGVFCLFFQIEDLKVKLQHATSQASDSTTSRQAAESARSRMLAFLQAPAPADLPLTLHSKDIREKQGLRPDVGSAGAGVGLKVTERDAKGKYREISEVFNLAGDVILSLQAELVLSKKREETLNHQVNTDVRHCWCGLSCWNSSSCVQATTISELKQSVASLQSEQETLGSKLADLESSLQEKVSCHAHFRVLDLFYASLFCFSIRMAP